VSTKRATDLDECRIAFDAPEPAHATIERLGRVEDVAFSPNNGRLALAASDRDSIGICNIDIELIGNRPRVAISNAVEYSSPSLNEPHGVDFLDDCTVIVANRQGRVTVHRLSSDDDAYGGAESRSFDASVAARFEQLGEPSSVTVVEHAGNAIEVLVGRNRHTVTRHQLDKDSLSVTSNAVLLKRYLDGPDGVAVSADNRWIAVSSHHNHHVMLYDRSRPLDENSDPHALLLGAHGPHGLRFSLDGRHLFVADTHNPYIHVYARVGEVWCGVQHSVASMRVGEDDVFQRAALEHSRGKAGLKGLDLDRRGRVLATTSPTEPLAFFDADAIVDSGTQHGPDHAQQLALATLTLEQDSRAAARIAALEQSTSFRITKPLRALKLARLRRAHR
jgi:hypothetical protein